MKKGMLAVGIILIVLVAAGIILLVLRKRVA